MKKAQALRRSVSFMMLALVSFWDVRLARAQTAEKPATTSSQLILIAVDGLSLNAIQTAQRQGMLQGFKVGAHVSTFPSMSDVAWNSILRTTDVFGQPGRLKAAEAVYFDESTQSLEGDPRDYYRRQAHPKFYMGAFEHFMNPYVESLMYFPTDEVPKMEVKTIVDELLASPAKPVLTGFIAATDSMAHTQHQKLFPVLKVIDAELARLQEGFRAKGVEPRIVLVSDHGNIGRFKEGEAEIELEKIDLQKDVEALGFRYVQKLEQPQDIAVPLLALGSWAPVYMKDRRRLPELVNGLSKQPWFDLAAWIKSSSAERLVMKVVSNSGEAEVVYDRAAKLYSYRALRGNPLRIDSVENVDANEAGRLTVNTQYPDSLYRLVEAGLHKEFDYPDLILTSKDGTCFNSSLSSFTKMFRTHGALNRNASLGIVASNFQDVPRYLRSKEILPYFKIDARELFGVEYQNSVMNSKDRLTLVQQNLKNGVATNVRDFSTPRIFRYLTRFLADTRPYFVIGELKSFFSAFKGNPFASTDGGTGALGFDPSKLDYKGLVTPEDLGKLTDEVIRNPDPKAIMNGPVLSGLKAKLEAQTGRSAGDVGSSAVGAGALGVSAKRAAMKLYQLPYLLDRSLSLQERTRVKETRDLGFAVHWSANREKLIVNQNSLTASYAGGTEAARLFAETHKEAQLAEKIFPAPLTKLYGRQLHDVTMVYVPGIYNSIFDNEIFSLGLLKMEEEYGLRVLKAPVESTCSTKYNGNLLMNFLKNDSQTQIARGHGAPRYIVISYSKGSNDTLAGFVQDPAWVSKNVAGMLSIASPLHGSSILNRADLPFQLVDSLSAAGGPEVCKTTEQAGPSITPSTMANFWRKNTRSLVGLTRYYSLTFATEIENAHLFMKATKLLAQFDEDNDGVVTVSSSKFPEQLGAIDFGTVDADHLSGVLSSHFDQKAFFSAIVTTLAEVGADDPENNLRGNLARITELASRGNKNGKITATVKGDLASVYQSGFLNITWKKLATDTKSSYEWNQALLPKIEDPSTTYETKTKLPDNNLKYDPYNLLDLRKLGSDLGNARVKPITAAEGIDMTFNQKNAVHFRMEHQLNYESSVQHNADDNAQDGYMPVEHNGSQWLRMHSKGTSIRLTTMAYRFRPVDYPKTSLQMIVNTPVVGADVIKGGTGKDDSAFQVWFTIRIGNQTGDRSTVDPKKDRIATFGYYWGTKDSKVETTAGQLFENYYSNKSYAGIATLPEAWEVLLENPNKTGVELNLQRDLSDDLKRAYPNVRPEDIEVIAITFQHDSNDTKSESDVLFKSLKFQK